MKPRTQDRQDGESELASTEARSRWLLKRHQVGVLLLLAVACGGTGFFASTAVKASEEDSRRKEALQVAQEAAVAILSYDHARLDEGVEAATRFLTPAFEREFREYSESTVEPMATKYRAALTSEMIGSGIERSESDDATVLIYLNQTTRSSQLVAPRVDSSTVRVRLKWTDGEWLLAGLEPI